ncbi:MAG TPA: CPBP family intramembrane glutamic endopeptidase [Acidimicrobiales bacterium]|nr:CPBP family intramembrane glutamic endopeptidase [Acidimicrobiales bacterium]
MDAPPPRWGLGDAALGLVLSTGLSIAFAGVWIDVQGGTRTSLGLALASLLGLWLGLAGVPVMAARRKGNGSVVEEFSLRVERSDVPLGVAAGLASQLVLVPLLYLPLRYLAPDFHERVGEGSEEILDTASQGGRLLLFLLLVVAAPLVEELFFRGLLQRALVRRIGRPAPAVAVAAAVFGLVHYDVAALLGLVAFGVVLGVLVVRTGRLGPAVVAHAAFNAVTVVSYVATS